MRGQSPDHPLGARTQLIAFVLAVVAGLGGHVRTRSQVPSEHTPSVGPYHLNMRVTELHGLREMTPDEVNALRLRMRFRGGRYYHAPAAAFGGVTWDVILTAVAGRVYRISSLFSAENADQRDAWWRQVSEAMRERSGAPKEFQEGTVLLWDMADGNVILSRPKSADTYTLMLALTSWAARGLERVR